MGTHGKLRSKKSQKLLRPMQSHAAVPELDQITDASFSSECTFYTPQYRLLARKKCSLVKMKHQYVRTPWDHSIKIWHYELNWDPRTLITPRVCRGPCPLCHNPLQCGCLWTWDPLRGLVGLDTIRSFIGSYILTNNWKCRLFAVHIIAGYKFLVT